MSLNSGSASGILQGSRYNRGAGTAGTGATHASTVDTGSVLRIETNKTNGIILYCQPETTVPSVNAEVQVTLLTAQSTNRGGAFVAPRVGDKIVWLTSKGNSFYLGMSHQATSPHPFLGDTDVDATTGGTNIGGASMLMTGMRIADQPLGTTSDDPLPIENAQVDGAPGTGFANVPGSDVLMDPKTNTFRSVGEITGNASPDKPYEAYDIPDSVFGTSSSGFKTVMQALNKAKDPAYAKAKGYGFNEISIQSRTATLQGGSGSTTGSSTAKSGTSPTNGGSVIPPGAKQAPNANPLSGAAAAAAAKVAKYVKNTNGSINFNSQDALTSICSGISSLISLESAVHYVGKTLTLEAGTEIILKVGDSSITINQDGIAIAQRELGGIGSSFKMSNDSIEAFSISHDISAWTYDVSVPWATLNLSPMNAMIAGCQGVEIKSGSQNFAPFMENLTEYVLQMASLTAAAIAAPTADKKDIELDMADATVMATLGVPLNFPVMNSSSDSPLSVPSGFAALDIVGPAMSMLNSIATELLACTAGKGGSATVKLNNADVTIQAGYIEQIPYPMILAMMATDAAAVAAATVTAASKSTSVSIGSAAVAAVIGAAAMACATRAPEEQLLIAGNGNIRIEASKTMTSGAYFSEEQVISGGSGKDKEFRVAKILSGALPPSVGWLLNLAAVAGYAKSIADSRPFAGVAGVGPQNSFLYHNLEIQTSSPMTHEVAVAINLKNIVTMTNILLEGPSAHEQGELKESAEHAADGVAPTDTTNTTRVDSKGTTTFTTVTKDEDGDLKQTETTEISPNGDLITTTKNKDGSGTIIHTDKSGRPTTVIKNGPNGDPTSTTTTEYKEGSTEPHPCTATKTSLPDGPVTTTEMDEHGRPTKGTEKSSGGDPISSTITKYPPDSTEPHPCTATKTFDDKSGTKTKTDNGGNPTTVINWNADNKTTSTTRMAYDANGDKTSEIETTHDPVTNLPTERSTHTIDPTGKNYPMTVTHVYNPKAKLRQWTIKN